MTLHWGQQYWNKLLPDEIQNESRLRTIQADPGLSYPGQDDYQFLPMYNGKTGELLAKAAGQMPIRVSRSKMRKLFSDGLDVQHNKTLVSISESISGVTAHFSDGATATGSMIVGTDSIRSVVRTHLFGEEKAKLTTLPFTYFNFTQTYSNNPELARKLRAIHPQFSTTFYPEGPNKGTMYFISIQDVPDEMKPETWMFQLFVSWKGGRQFANADNTPEECLKHMKKVGADWAEPWRSAAMNLKDGTPIQAEKVHYWADPLLHDNHNGQITLAGDSAHPMTPHRGQGLHYAIQDANNFVEACVKIQNGVSAKLAIDAYDQEVFERGSREIEISLKSSYAIHDYDALMNSPLVKVGMRKRDG